MKRRISIQQNLINHVGFVFDASASMRGKDKELIKVADELIAFLKEKSQSYNQETRATMYIFGSDNQVACYDVDVLRTPSIAALYEPTGGSTALIDASFEAIRDLNQTATLYGDHAFLLYVLTDGYENSSRRDASQLHDVLTGLSDNWTVAALAPDRMSQNALVSCGFSLENTLVWNATTAQGVADVGRTIIQATDNYMQARSQGVRGTRSLFNLDSVKITQRDIRKAKKLDMSSYHIFTVQSGGPIRDVVENFLHKHQYRVGEAFYQLTKTEEIQPNKEIAIRDKTTREIYGGDEARQLLGLPNSYVKVSPSHNPNFDIFVQSTSVNRKILPNTDLLVVK